MGFFWTLSKNVTRICIKTCFKGICIRGFFTFLFVFGKQFHSKSKLDIDGKKAK